MKAIIYLIVLFPFLCFGQAIKKNKPNQKLTKYDLLTKSAAIELDKKQYDLALNDLNLALELNPKGDFAYYLKAVLLFESDDKDFKAQLDYIKTAIYLNRLPESFYYVQRAEIQDSLKNYDEALQDYKLAILKATQEKGFPKKRLASIYSERAHFRVWSVHDNESALYDFNKAIEIDPASYYAFEGRGTVKSMMGDDRGAINDYNKAIILNPKESTAYFNRAGCKYSLGDKEGACLDWSKAGELGDMGAYESIRKHCQ
jgi:tetratricopeptide (TPR) repeat protein